MATYRTPLTQSLSSIITPLPGATRVGVAQIGDITAGPLQNVLEAMADRLDARSGSTAITVDFTQPAVSSNVTATVRDTTWIAQNQVVFVEGGGYYTAFSITDDTHIILRNLGYTGNATPGATVTNGSLVSPSGVQGPAGNVTSVFSRTGVVVAQSGDYTAAQVGALPIGGGTLTGALVLSGDGSSALNPISLQQWQTRAWKDPVTAATTGALPTNTRSGNVLTASANGALAAQDGVTLVAANSLFVKNEATGANNGLYTVTNAGAAGAPWVLTRRSDADTSAKIAAGLIVKIQQGTTLSGKVWRMTNAVAPTLNTTALTVGAVPTDWADLTGKPSTFAPSAHATSHDLGASDAIKRYHIFHFSYKGTLAITAGVLRIRVPTVLAPFTVVEIGATVNTPSSSGSIILDVNKALAASLSTITTLYTTQGNRPTIAASARDVVATLPDVTSFASGDHLTVDIDSAGTGAADLVGYVVVRY